MPKIRKSINSIKIDIFNKIHKFYSTVHNRINYSASIKRCIQKISKSSFKFYKMKNQKPNFSTYFFYCEKGTIDKCTYLKSHNPTTPSKSVLMKIIWKYYVIEKWFNFINMETVCYINEIHKKLTHFPIT